MWVDGQESIWEKMHGTELQITCWIIKKKKDSIVIYANSNHRLVRLRTHLTEMWLLQPLRVIYHTNPLQDCSSYDTYALQNAAATPFSELG